MINPKNDKMQNFKRLKKIGNLIIVTSLLLASCKSEEIRIDALEEYFQDNKIEVSVKKDRMSIFVDNSTLINLQSQKKGIKWNNAESFASIGALICFDYIEKYSLHVDSIVFKIKEGGKTENYSFRILDIETIKNQFLICSEFARLASSNKLDSAKALLDIDIFSKMPKEKLDQYIQSMYSGERVNKSEILAFKITPSYNLIYLNSYFEEQNGVTYIYGFNKNKILGITLP